MKGFPTEISEVSASKIVASRGSGAGSRARAGGGPSRGEDELDVFVFPVYAMSMPRIMNRYMRSLGKAGPELRRPKAAILSTNGRISAKWRDGHEGQALAQAERILRRLGWEVVYRDTFDYPQNITTVLSAQDEGRRAAIMAQVQPRIEAAADDLAAGHAKKRPCRAWALLVGWPFGALYRLIGRRVWGMLFAADERCDGCGLCAARCPAGAIKMRGGGPHGARPDWSYACERCMNLCPKKAIQTSYLRIGIIAALCIWINFEALKPAVGAFLGFLPAAAFEAAWLVLAPVLAVVLDLALLRLIDLGLAFLSRVPGLRPILAFGWTRWTRRYPDPSRAANAGKS